jgi:hypothetical protein
MNVIFICPLPVGETRGDYSFPLLNCPPVICLPHRFLEAAILILTVIATGGEIRFVVQHDLVKKQQQH